MKRITLVFSFIIFCSMLMAQAPQGISHQAVIRNSSNEVVTNSTIGIRVSILQGTPTGTVVYRETHTPVSNANGLITYVIGQGAVETGQFDTIKWANGPYFLQTEADPAGGTTYTISGTTQILSVPYAYYSDNSANGFASVYSETDHRPVLDTIGNIGIGTSPSWLKLNVDGGLRVGSGPLSWGSMFVLDASALEKGKAYVLSSSGGDALEGGGKLLFVCGGKGNIMVMDSLLNVGIGTDTPNFKLDVNGDINFTGDLYKNDSLYGFASYYTEGEKRPVINENGDIGLGTYPDFGKLNVNGNLRVGPGQNTWGTMIFLDAAPTAKGKTYQFASTGGEASEGEGKLLFECAGKGIIMTMDSLLNVGIGTDSPTSKLDVVGTINVNNNNITNVATPVNNNDAVNKGYVDLLQAQLQSQQSQINKLQNTLIAGGFVEDVDGNRYNTVKIGTQAWMAENLKTTKYNDGTTIPLVTDSSGWAALTTPGFCWYNNEETIYKSTYGALYNWFVVDTASNGNKNLCPVSWHVPSEVEWTILSDYLGGADVAGGKLKEIGTTHWFSPNTGATDQFGYSALPGAYRYWNGSFGDIGISGYWYSSTELWSNGAGNRHTNYNDSGLSGGGAEEQDGFSVRCLKDGPPIISTSSVSSIFSTTAVSGGNLTSDGGATVTARGVCWSISSNPTISDNKTTDGTGSGSFVSSITGLTANTTYHVRAYATNSAGIAYGSDESFTTYAATDFDGNNYTSVTIGTQVWMVENLKVTHYRNGDAIPYTTGDWTSYSTGVYCDYGNIPGNGVTYGRIYNGYAVFDSRNIAPEGWHVPTDAEWTTLTDYLTNNGYGYEGSGNDIGKSMATTSGWLSDDTAGNVGNDQLSNNSSGFTALPSGYRHAIGIFVDLGRAGYWWSGTEKSPSVGYVYVLVSIRSYIDKSDGTGKEAGTTIRCIKN
jgi:uncharacterized protein (TIGR02145 family)